MTRGNPITSSVHVVGVGIVSPAGFTSSDHVFFVRAGLVQPVASPFLDQDDEPIPSSYCPWIPPDRTLAERIEQLALTAAWEATREGSDVGRTTYVSLVTSPPSPGLDVAGLDGIASNLKRWLGVAAVRRFEGAAGFHAALEVAEQQLTADRNTRVCIVATDSCFETHRVQWRNRKRRVPWVPLEPAPSEAAAAVLLSAERSSERPPLATLLGVATARGASTDFNDEPVDGVGLTYLLRKLPNRGGVPMVFGPYRSDNMRRREWALAAARSRSRLGSPYALQDVEMDIGQVGDAAGAVHFAYGVACNHHRAVNPAIPPRSPFYAWAISGDGTRGLALLEGCG